jgi:hypothetical protein
MHYAYLTVAMIGDEYLDELTEMSQVCEQDLATLQVLKPVLEIIVLVDAVKQFEGSDHDSGINGSFRKVRDARMGNTAPVQRRIVSIVRHDDTTVHARVLENR